MWRGDFFLSTGHTRSPLTPWNAFVAVQLHILRTPERSAGEHHHNNNYYYCYCCCCCSCCSYYYYCYCYYYYYYYYYCYYYYSCACMLEGGYSYMKLNDSNRTGTLPGSGRNMQGYILT